MSRAAELEAIRTRITKLADPVGVLADIAAGKPLALRDWEGEIVDYERPSITDRKDAAKTLLDRIIPSLKAVDVNSDGTPGMTVIFNSPIPLPNSQPAIGGEVDPAQIEAAARQIEGVILEAATEDDD